MTALKLAIHAGSLPAARTTVPLCQIGPQRHPPPGRAPCDPQVCTHTYHRPPSQSDRVDRCRPTPSRPTLRSNLHSARCTLRALPTAISFLGAFQTPAAGARGWHRGCRRPKTCTKAGVPITSPDCLAHGRCTSVSGPGDFHTAWATSGRGRQKQERGQGAFVRHLPTFRRNVDWRTTAIKRAKTGAV